MLFDSSTTIVLFCPSCGSLSWHVLSLFAFNKQKRAFICDCNAVILTVEKRKDSYRFTTGCDYCGMMHTHLFTRKELLSNTIHELICPEVEGIIGLIGPRSELKQHLEKHQSSFSELALEIDSGDYFENSSVMLEILEKIDALVEADEFRCACGNKQIEIEILPDQVEFRCSECNQEFFIPAIETVDLDIFDLNGFLPKGWPSGRGNEHKPKSRLRLKSHPE